jgi:NADH:ubiquinone oxidoreductase subunit 5 (subunit L)/multisubunit Na+/H+ antiporter MnhA subunit
VAPGTRATFGEAYHFDEAYEELAVEPGRELGDILTRDVEPYGPRGLVAASVGVMRDAAAGLRVSQSGLVRAYAFALIAGVAILGVIFAIVLH